MYCLNYGSKFLAYLFVIEDQTLKPYSEQICTFCAQSVVMMPANQRKFGAGWVEFELKHRSLADSGGLLVENVNLAPDHANSMPCKLILTKDINFETVLCKKYVNINIINIFSLVAVVKLEDDLDAKIGIWIDVWHKPFQVRMYGIENTDKCVGFYSMEYGGYCGPQNDGKCCGTNAVLGTNLPYTNWEESILLSIEETNVSLYHVQSNTALVVGTVY